jgi:hypothetical protein
MRRTAQGGRGAGRWEDPGRAQEPDERAHPGGSCGEVAVGDGREPRRGARRLGGQDSGREDGEATR